MLVIRSFVIEDYEQVNFNEKNSYFLDKVISYMNWNVKIFVVVNIIIDLVLFIVIVCVGYFVINGLLIVGMMVVFVGYIDRMYNFVRRLINFLIILIQLIVLMDRVFEFIDELYEFIDKLNVIKVDQICGEVEF